MIDLKRSDRNKLSITDLASETPVVIYYRTPTTVELVEYNQKMIRMTEDGSAVVDQQARIDAVLNVLTGFDEGVFGFDGQAISSDEGKPGYRPDWKDILRDTGAKYLLPAATVIFETLGVKALPFGTS